MTMSTTTTRENRAIVRGFHEEVLNGKDLDAIGAYYAVDCVDHAPGTEEGELRGVGAIRAYVEQFLVAFPDLTITEEDVIAEGDRVAYRHTGRGTHEGEFMGHPPGGNGFEVGGIAVFRIEDRKIAESWCNVDMLGLVDQLGIPPGE